MPLPAAPLLRALPLLREAQSTPKSKATEDVAFLFSRNQQFEES
jgi:hypothetical protein